MHAPQWIFLINNNEHLQLHFAKFSLSLTRVCVCLSPPTPYCSLQTKYKLHFYLNDNNFAHSLSLLIFKTANLVLIQKLSIVKFEQWFLMPPPPPPLLLHRLFYFILCIRVVDTFRVCVFHSDSIQYSITISFLRDACARSSSRTEYMI